MSPKFNTQLKRSSTMITKPKLEDRAEQHYAGIRTQVPMEKLPIVIPQFIAEVSASLGKQGVSPSGAPFIRYHVINMPGRLDIEVGWPVASAVSGDGHVSAGVLPAGRYATLIYTGDYPGLMEANRVLIDWAKENGIKWDRWDDENGDAFRSRYESYLTNPEEEPDRAKHETEVAIKLADE
jgi:effector-binding domain-containing protein